MSDETLVASLPASSFILLLSSPLSSEHGTDVISDEAIELCADVGSGKGFGDASVLGDSVTSDEGINDGSEVAADVAFDEDGSELVAKVGPDEGIVVRSLLDADVSSDEGIKDVSEVSAGVVTAFCCKRFENGVGTNLCCRFP